jgi:hypothetical protein
MSKSFYYPLHISHKKKKELCKLEQQPTPTISSLYQMIIELDKKYNHLENKYNQLLKSNSTKLSPTNWLQTYKNESFVDIYQFMDSNFIVQLEDVQRLFQKTFIDSFEHILSRIDFSQSFLSNMKKPYHIYGIVFNKETNTNVWQELNNDILLSLFNKCKRIFFASAFEHKLQIKLDSI